MKVKDLVCSVLVVLLALLFLAPAVWAADPPKGPVTVKLEGAKMAPVTFSHSTHLEKAKLECVKCHHKDAASPKACTTCHMKDATGKTPSGKDAFHTLCQTCHKDLAAKGGKAPTKCMECHKK